MLIIFDKTHPVVTHARTSDASFFREIREASSAVIEADGPDQLYDVLRRAIPWENDVVVVGGVDAMAAVLSAWINAGRDIKLVRWSYFGVSSRDAWTTASEARGSHEARWRELAGDPGIAEVRLVRVDVSTSPEPRYGLSVAFGAFVPLWASLARRRSGALGLAKFGMDYARRARAALPRFESPAAWGEHSRTPNAALVFLRDPFRILAPGQESRSSAGEGVQQIVGRLDPVSLLDAVRDRSLGAALPKSTTRSSTLRGVDAWSLDGWTHASAGGGVVRVGRGPVVYLHRLDRLC